MLRCCRTLIFFRLACDAAWLNDLQKNRWVALKKAKPPVQRAIPIGELKMSRKTKHSPLPTPQTGPPKSQSTSLNDRSQWFAIVLAFGMGAWANWYSCSSADSARRSADAAREANDRSAGKIQARVSVEKLINAPLERVKNIWLSRVNENGVYSIIHFRNPEDLTLFNPVVGVRNEGDDPVDSVKIDVRVREIYSYFPPKAKKPNPDDIQHIITRQSAPVEHILNGKLLKGGVARVSIIRPILEHILDCYNPKAADNPLEAVFEIRCYGKLPGATSFDGPSDDSNMVGVKFSWDPRGFPEEKIRPNLALYQATPVIIPFKNKS